MDNIKENNSESVKKKFVEKYGVWLMLVGLVAIIYILKYILEYIEK